ncbi:bifunctional diguanylate cyclase/phosphodiesterase [Rhizobium sp. CNPSo 3968]|uniref:putative bifunctional diguanylate cyclase/phosphodiesterase n=1 Tax=Rhizobium sp. CNPSo 3968 TaxID=3021408 RepID=UPI00146D5944|nr:bifunctional diguanylate cyclase/phosphodiesterase [Rhizobium sp. CNPSo 3968]MDK4721079.1 bifunctional diguanylate cyclase/phosphodiesterase [Rhizobium sp. CNPSo 3968]
MPENRVDRSQRIPYGSESANGSEAMISLWDLDLKLLDSSKRFKEHIGLAFRNEMTLWEAYPTLAKPAFAELIRQVIDTGEPRTIRLDDPKRRNASVLVSSIRAGLLIVETNGAITKDVPPSADDEKALLIHQATHDVLTGLPNRRQFSSALAQLFPVSGKIGPVLMQLDLDDFKPVNDTLGHGAGDIVLKLAAERIKDALGRGGTVYRLAGDEFAIIQAGTQRTLEAEKLAEALVAEFKKPFTVNGISVFVGVSVGIAIAPRDGNEGEQLMKAADVALYAAKQEGRRRARTFDPAMLIVVEQRELLRRSLRVALQRDEFFIEYQPLVKPPSNVVGFEALLRWRHPTLGVIPPAAFIPMAEADGLMRDIGQWMLEEACREALAWPAHYTLAVNLSPAEFLTPGLTDRISQTLDIVGFPAERLELEITEGVLLERTTNNLDTLNTLNVLGIQISLDDFGTEYSSLSYLKNFPFDTIKIDRYFIRDLLQDTKGQTIVRSVIGLAHGLDMQVTAEGVETQQQAVWLQKEGCDRLQGYGISPPLGADKLDDFIRQGARTQSIATFGEFHASP